MLTFNWDNENFEGLREIDGKFSHNIKIISRNVSLALNRANFFLLRKKQFSHIKKDTKIALRKV